MSATATDPLPTTETVQDGWHVLVVDDEPDVHDATRLAVKRKTWRKRPFVLSGVSSAKQARDLLFSGDYRHRVQVAIVDVVMETRFAGLDLCRFIRSELPRSVRIILRTGQPGVAPEERIINDYDIDFYLAKTEVTAERLYMALRACLRSSQDIETLLAFGNQLRSFTTALQKMNSKEDLTRFMRVGLDFLELKHAAHISFISDIDSPEEPNSTQKQAVGKAFSLELETGKLHPASEVGVPDTKWSVAIFSAKIEGASARRSGFVVEAPPASQHGLQNDLVLFMQNWSVALSGLLAQTRVVQGGQLTELAYLDRIGGIATVLGGATQRIHESVSDATHAVRGLKALSGEFSGAAATKLDEATKGLETSLTKTNGLISTFEKISATQLRDERVSIDLVGFVRSCVDLVPRGAEQVVNVTSSKPELEWLGFPGSLAQVIIKLVQGAVRHAYEDDAGKVDVRLSEHDGNYRLEVEDYGRGGVPVEVIERLENPFETPMPTTVGLKLVVTHTIVERRLGGRISCVSKSTGTKFTVTLPREVPAPE